FSRFVLVPAAAELPDAEHDKLRAGVLARWRRFVHAGIALLLVTGVYNYFRAIAPHAYIKKIYHPLIGPKILLALVVFMLASMLVGRSSAGTAMRQRAKFWLGWLAALGIAIVLISGYAKVMLPGQLIGAPSAPAGSESP